MFSPSDLKKGLKIQIDGAPWIITEFDFCKPGKGTALYRCRLKNMINGSGMEKTYRPTDKIEKPDLEEREMFYSYFDGHHYIFSDPTTYEEMAVSAETLGQSGLLPDRGQRLQLRALQRPADRNHAADLHRKGDHRNRAGSPRRHRDQRDQAGQNRQRLRNSGSALHQPGRYREDRHPHRRLCRTGQQGAELSSEHLR